MARTDDVKFASTNPSSITNLNLIADANPEEFRGIFGANFGKNGRTSLGVSPDYSLSSCIFGHDLANPAIIEQLSCAVSHEMVHYFNVHSEEMVLSRLNCLTLWARGL